MHNNPNTDSEGPPLDAEDWNIVFQAYSEFPVLAFILAQHLETVKELIEQGPEGRAEAIAGIDRAIECLMRHTQFRDAGRKVYLLAVAGNLSTDQEDKLRELGLLDERRWATHVQDQTPCRQVACAPSETWYISATASEAARYSGIYKHLKVRTQHK